MTRRAGKLTPAANVEVEHMMVIIPSYKKQRFFHLFFKLEI